MLKVSRNFNNQTSLLQIPRSHYIRFETITSTKAPVIYLKPGSHTNPQQCLAITRKSNLFASHSPTFRLPSLPFTANLSLTAIS
jgi:hypothetical protein